MTLHRLCTGLLLVLLCGPFLTAQPASNWSFAAGIGAVPTFIKGPRVVDVPPVSVRLDYRVRPHFSLSAYAGYSATTSQLDYSHDGLYLPLRNDYYIGGLRAAFHTITHTCFDFYGGTMLGYNLPVISQVGSDAPVVLPKGKPHYYRLPEAKWFLSGFVGGNYQLLERIHLYGEVGFGVSLVQLGARVRI